MPVTGLINVISVYMYLIAGPITINLIVLAFIPMIVMIFFLIIIIVMTLCFVWMRRKQAVDR